MSERPGEVISRIHSHLQEARSEAAAIEDPSARRAVGGLAAATAERLAALPDRTD